MAPPAWLVMPREMVRPESVAVIAQDREHLDGVVAADRHDARAGAVDHLRPGGFIQLQRAGELDRLRRGCIEDRRVELDLAAGGVGVGVGLGDAVEQVARGRPTPCRYRS